MTKSNLSYFWLFFSFCWDWLVVKTSPNRGRPWVEPWQPTIQYLAPGKAVDPWAGHRSWSSFLIYLSVKRSLFNQCQYQCQIVGLIHWQLKRKDWLDWTSLIINVAVNMLNALWPKYIENRKIGERYSFLTIFFPEKERYAYVQDFYYLPKPISGSTCCL